MAAIAPRYEEYVPCPIVPPEIVAKLYAPLPAEAITPHPSKPFLSSIKAIYVIERLNQVFGMGGWSYRVRIIEANPSQAMVVVKVSLVVPAYGIALEQFGGNDNPDRGDAYKGAVTDALSKMAGYLGIGIDVYKGGGPTKNQPRGRAVTQPRSADWDAGTRAAAEVARLKIDQLRNGQAAAELAAEVPEPEDEDRFSEHEPPSEIEQQLHDSIVLAEAAKEPPKRCADYFVMLQAFGQVKKRYQAINFVRTYYAYLGQYGVHHANEFEDTPEGLSMARCCYKKMSLDVSNREARRKK